MIRSDQTRQIRRARMVICGKQGVEYGWSECVCDCVCVGHPSRATSKIQCHSDNSSVTNILILGLIRLVYGPTTTTTTPHQKKTIAIVGSADRRSRRLLSVDAGFYFYTESHAHHSLRPHRSLCHSRRLAPNTMRIL